MGLTSYLKDTKAELRHVSWPTQRQTRNYTILVIFVSLIVAAFLGFFDFIFDKILQQVIVSETTVFEEINNTEGLQIEQEVIGGDAQKEEVTNGSIEGEENNINNDL